MPASINSNGATLLAVGTALVSIAAAIFYLKKMQGKTSSNHNGDNNNNNSNNNNKKSPQQQQNNGNPQLLQLFEVAAKESKQLTHRLSNTEKLILYSLYKQSREGDAIRPKKKGGFSLNLVEKAKFSAWERLQGMTTTQAMMHYIEGVQQLVRHNGSSMDETNGMDSLEAMVDALPLEGGLGNKPSTLLAGEEGDGDDGFGDRSDMSMEQRLLRAASENDTTELSKIVNQQPNLAVNHRDEDGQSALHLAADKGATEALTLLLNAGADGSAADDDGITVLHAAVIGESVEACRLLLVSGVNPDQADVDGDTPRKCAQEDGSDEMKQLFAVYPSKK